MGQRRPTINDIARAAGVSVATVSRAMRNLPNVAPSTRARLIAGSSPPSAVFCMSDEMAFGALQAASRAGLAVPDDLSVIGFDDHELAEALGLTTMRQSVAEMGVMAAEEVLALIGGRDAPRDITWEVPLVVRRTTTAAMSSSAGPIPRGEVPPVVRGTTATAG